MKNFLFICGKNKHRSPTAEEIFNEYEDIEVRSAGINNDAVCKVSVEDIQWATDIFVMENSQRRKINNKFKDYLKDKKIVVLNIPDKYTYMDPELVTVLRNKVARYTI